MSEHKTLAEVMRDHSFIRMTCYDHDKPCCPAGCHDVAESQYEHYERVVLAHLASEQVVEAVVDKLWPRLAPTFDERVLLERAFAAQREVLEG